MYVALSTVNIGYYKTEDFYLYQVSRYKFFCLIHLQDVYITTPHLSYYQIITSSYSAPFMMNDDTDYLSQKLFYLCHGRWCWSNLAVIPSSSDYLEYRTYFCQGKFLVEPNHLYLWPIIPKCNKRQQQKVQKFYQNNR